MRGKLLLVASSLGLIAQPAMAQDIVVKGKALTKEQAREQAAAFVQNIGIVTTVKPAARWIDPVCPRAVGIVDDKAAMVVARIRQVAAMIGARVAKPDCKANIIVTFSDDGGALVRNINALDPRQLSEVPHSQKDRLLSDRAPMRWWYNSHIRSGDSMPGAGAPLPWMNTSNEGGTGPGERNGTESTSSGPSNLTGSTTNGYSSSLIASTTKRSIEIANVVIDVKLAEGKAFGGVIDHAAMVALAEIWPQGEMPGVSILSLFSGKPSSLGLSAQDEALLKALYRMPLDREGRYHRARLARDVSSALSATQ